VNSCLLTRNISAVAFAVAYAFCAIPYISLINAWIAISELFASSDAKSSPASSTPNPFLDNPLLRLVRQILHASNTRYPFSRLVRQKPLRCTRRRASLISSMISSDSSHLALTYKSFLCMDIDLSWCPWFYAASFALATHLAVLPMH
jgi:hypothetical protein